MSQIVSTKLHNLNLRTAMVRNLFDRLILMHFDFSVDQVLGFLEKGTILTKIKSKKASFGRFFLENSVLLRFETPGTVFGKKTGKGEKENVWLSMDYSDNLYVFYLLLHFLCRRIISITIDG